MTWAAESVMIITRQPYKVRTTGIYISILGRFGAGGTGMVLFYIISWEASLSRFSLMNMNMNNRPLTVLRI